MKLVTPLVLAAAAAAVFAAVVVPPRECPAQDAPAPKFVDRIHDIAGIRGPRFPRWADDESGPVVRPFGVSPGLFEGSGEHELSFGEQQPDATNLAEWVRAAFPLEMETGADIDPVWEGAAIRVRGTEEMQKRVEGMLEQLRRGAAPWEFDVRAVTLPPDDEGAALLADLERLGGATLPAALAERLLAADLNGGLRGGPLTAAAGAPARIERIESRAYVLDWDVEIAQAASIADPIASTFEDGLRATVSVLPASDGRALVSLQATAGDVVEPVRRVELRTKDHGSAEMPALRGGYVSTEWLAAPGDATAVILASPVDATSSVRQVLLVRLVAAPPRSSERGAALIPCGALAGAAEERFLACPAFEPSPSRCRGALGLAWKEAAVRLDGSALAERIQSAAAGAMEREGNYVSFGTTWPGGGVIAIGGEKGLVETAASVIARTEAEMLRPARLSVRLAARSGTGAADRTVGIVAAPALAGRNVALAAYTSIPYVGDWDVEVAQEARIADPIINVAVGGAVLNVRLSQGPANGWRADLLLVAASAGPVEAIPVTAAEVGTTERVAVRRARAEQILLLENGKPKEIDLGANLWGTGRLVAIVRVDR